MADRSRIRCIAICVIQHHRRWLVLEGYDPVSQDYFYRPLGGGIELGETGSDAVQREFFEETGHRITTPEYKETLENIFIYKGKVCHELVRVYAADLRDEALYQEEQIIAHEDNGTPFKVLWVPVQDFINRSKRLVPEGLLLFLNPTDPC